MAKKIKFHLEMANEVKVRTLDELRDNFDLDKVIGYFFDGKLMNWLEDRYYESECDRLLKLDKDDSQLKQKLCKILGFEYEGEVDLEKIELRNQRISKLKQYTDDATILEKVDIVAFDQEDLANLIDEGEETIYLCGKIFTIPLKVLNKRYIGVGETEVVINSKEKINFLDKCIQFKNIVFDEKYRNLTEENPDDFYRLGENYEKGTGVEKDYQKALIYYQKAIDLGHVRAMCMIGDLYRLGHGVEENIEIAVEWYKKAADLNDGQAVNNLGAMYIRGMGLPKDSHKGMILLEKAFDLGDSGAASNLGSMYYYGIEVEPNLQTAKKWYKKASDLENEDAMKMLGIIDEKLGNYKECLLYYEKAANLGNVNAMYNLARIYDLGKGIIEDCSLAYTWYKKAADNGNAWAMYNIGRMYNNGTGVERDWQKAYEWYLKSANAGNESAKSEVKRFDEENDAGYISHGSNYNIDPIGEPLDE